jgi:lipopolysaccharide/colanic/teichoic acid biosynthesis glycosyltransferase
VDDVREKLNYDLEYIRQRSALEDLKIMLLTPAVMLGRRYGW